VKRTLWRVAKWLLGAGILAVVVWLNWDKMLEMLEQSSKFEPHWLLVAGTVFFVGTLITFFRWYLLVRAQGLPFRHIDAVRLGFIGLFFSSFLPGSVGGDLVKAGYIAREQHRRTAAIATIILDRIVGLVGLIFLAGIAGVLFWSDANAVVDVSGDRPLRWIVLFVWGTSGALLLGAALLVLLPVRGEPIIARLTRVPKVGGILAEVMRAVQMYRHKYHVVALATLLAMVGHVGFVMSFYFAARAVPPPIPTVEEHCLLIPVGMVVESVPLTPGNIGVGEAIYEYLYHLVDTRPGQYDGKGALARLGQRGVSWVVALIGFCFYLPLRGTVRRIMAEGEAAEEELKAPLLTPPHPAPEPTRPHSP
jgi:uncharacterized membrane protein YbhN (UPF0104 family)